MRMRGVGSRSRCTWIPTRPVALQCTYWGSDSGARTFDILVGGEKLATQTLNNDKPGEFFDVTYEVPAALTKGRKSVTVRFQAQPGNMAGGLFDCRMVRGVVAFSVCSGFSVSVFSV